MSVLDAPARIAELDEQLARAHEAARTAYADSARLVRLLEVIGQPGSPEQQARRAVDTFSSLFAADVVCLVRGGHDPAGPGPAVLTSCGLADDLVQLPALPAALLPPDPTDQPCEWLDDGTACLVVGGVPVRSAVLVRLSRVDVQAGSLLLLRSTPAPWSPAEVRLVASAAERLHSALESAERHRTAELLATAGRHLAYHQDEGRLLQEAVRVLARLTGATVTGAGELTVPGGRVAVVSYHEGVRGAGTSAGGRPWPPAEWTLPAGEDPLAGTVLTPDLRHDPTRAPSGPVRTLLRLPVRCEDGPSILLYAASDRPWAFARSVVDAAELLAGFVGAALSASRSLRALVRSEDDLRRRATHDELTGLANRTLLREHLLDRLSRPETGAVGLLFLDLDDFKAVNDRLGHEAGDELLRRVADRLRPRLRPTDLLCRLGGDEFVLLLSGDVDPGTLAELGQRLIDALAEPFVLPTPAGELELGQVWASVGGASTDVAEVTDPVDTATTLLRDADAAMYEAKRAGRRRVRVFDAAAAQASLRLLTLRQDVRRAHERGELAVHYQPVVDLLPDRVIGFEALVRWTHPELGPVGPDVFVPIAEETGAIDAIGAFVLDQACADLQRWRQLPGQEQLRVAVNLSPLQLLDADLPAAVLRTVRGHGLTPVDVHLEITENLPVGAVELACMRRLHEDGFALMVDDFGVGHSNLGRLKELSASGLKIDRSLVQDLGTGRTLDVGVVRALVALSQSTGLILVAEGIETSAQRNSLLALGCRRGQGYLMSRPVPGAQVPQLLSSWRRGRLVDAR